MTSQLNDLKILNNSFYSVGFPDKEWSKLVPRDNYLTLIANVLDSDKNILFLEGEEDSGKTTLLAQFARKKMDSCITVFFNPRNNIDYQLEFFCANVYHQVSNILGLESSSDINRGLISVEEYRSNVFNLRKKLKQRREKIYLLIDGLESKIGIEPEFVRQLFQIIPLADESFKIIVSGFKSEFIKQIETLRKIGEINTLSVTGFSKPEIINFLGEGSHTESRFEELYKITKGYPGRLMTLKRLIDTKNYSFDDITSSSSYSAWVEMDCEAVDLEKDSISLIFSLLSLKDDSFSIDEISTIFNFSKELVDKVVEDAKVLESRGDKVFIISSAHKKYYSNQLRANRKLINDCLINYYANSDSIKSLIELPKLYMDQSDWAKVISVLDGETLPKILDNYGSLHLVNQSLDMGIEASSNLGKHNDLWRFAIQGGIVNELDNYTFWESEIEARIAIDDFASAIKLAESAVLKIDRFRLLALIARRQKELNNSVDEELVNLIRVLYESTDLHTVGNKIYDIVADLIYAIPNLAIELIEKSSGSVSEKNINDWVVAKLSIAAIDSNNKDGESEGSNKKLEAIEKLNAPLVKKISKAISFLVGNYSANKVIEESNKLSDSNEKLRLLRLWLNNNKRNIANIESVISLALDELINSTSTDSFTLDVLKDLSFQLPYVKNIERKRDLLARFQKIECDFTELGLTTNKYIYQLNIFHTKYSLEEVDTSNFINTIISEIENIDDVLVKLDSFAEVYAKIIILKRSNFDLKPKINFLHSRLLSLSDKLFKSTANHYKITQALLSTISKKNPVLALTICSQINTEVRRERAKFLILDSYLDNNLKYIRIDILKKIEQSLIHEESRGDFIIRILERYAEAQSLHYNVVQELFYFIHNIPKIKMNDVKAFAQMLAYKVIAKDKKWKSRLCKKTSADLLKIWDSLDTEWEKIDIGFKICFHLSKIDRDFTQIVFDKTNDLKEACWLDSRLVARTYLLSLSLIIKAYNSLLISKNDAERDYKIIEGLIDQVPSIIERIRLWTQLAVYAFIEKREDISRKAVETHIIPLFQDVMTKNYNFNDLTEIFIPIHIYNSDLVKDFVKSFPAEVKEDIYSSLCDFYITKRNPFEIYDKSYDKYGASHNDLLKAVKILNELRTDSTIYSELNNLCKAINENKTLTKPQIANLAHELLHVVHNKFPDPRNIKHEGFQILTDLKLTLLDRKSINNKTYWKTLIERAKVIPNSSDLVFINSILLDELPFDKMENGSIEKRELFSNTIEILKSLPAHYEFVQRVIDITDTMYSIDRNKWKEVVSNAFTVTKKLDAGSEVFESQRNIIDSMHRLDPEFAKTLVKHLDNKDSPESHSKYIKEHLQTLELAKKIKNSKGLTEKETENDKKLVGAIIEALRALNSDKITTKKISEITKYLKIGNKLPLHEVFPVYMYYLTNCAKTYNGKTYEGNVANLHKNNFEEAVKATNIVQLLSHKRKSSEKKSKSFFIDEDFTTNKAIHPGSREEAINFIRNWISDEVEEFLIIADPYLNATDLEILKLILELEIDVNIDILGSKAGISNSIEEDCRAYWKKNSDQLPPFTNITFCWIPDKDNDTPFHDRWLISKNGGLRLGTSLSSMGIGKESEMSVMKPSEALNIKEQTLTDYISRRKREVNGMRITYKSFSL